MPELRPAGRPIARSPPLARPPPARPAGLDASPAADRVKDLWCTLAEETVTGLPDQTAADLPGILTTLTANVDSRRTRTPHGRRDGG